MKITAAQRRMLAHAARYPIDGLPEWFLTGRARQIVQRLESRRLMTSAYHGNSRHYHITNEGRALLKGGA